ncbi:MAG: hypothetical protein ABI620_10610, partial [Chloroflexota bacterium]
MTPRPWPVALGMLAILWLSACGGPSAGSQVPSGATTQPATIAPETSLPSGATVSPAPPSAAPATPAATPILNAGFQLGDILKVQVNSLAARIAPKRTAALVHAYDLSGPAPIDGGVVRLDKGDFVSVELGPVPVGDTVWYLVWPAPGAKLHPGGLEWYAGPPATGPPGPGWMAASVAGDVYLRLERHPDATERATTFGSLAVAAAGLGNYVSAPQPRHDGFQLDWAAATPASGTTCSLKITLVPADADVDPKVAVETTTTTVKVAPVDGLRVTAPWLPAAEGSWETFTVKVASTCNWA